MRNQNHQPTEHQNKVAQNKEPLHTESVDYQPQASNDEVKRLIKNPRLADPRLILQLQRVIGNRAVTELLLSEKGNNSPISDIQSAEGMGKHINVTAAPSTIQRRLPDYEEVKPLLEGPQAERVAKKLQQSLRHEFNKLTGPQKELVRGEYLDKGTGIKFDQLINTVLKKEEYDFLRDGITSMKDAIKDDNNPYKIVHPGRLENKPPDPDTSEKNNLDQLVTNAIKTMETIGNGDHDDAVDRVFGASREKAKETFRKSAIALQGLHKNNAINRDIREQSGPMRTGALTNKEGSLLSPSLFSAVTPENEVKLIHESTHAIDDGDKTGDDIYTDAEGFLTASEALKLKNAAHFEEVARQILLGGEQRVFKPAGKDGVKDLSLLEQAQKEANTTITHAWIVAIWIHDELLRVAKMQKDGKLSGLENSILIESGEYLSALSKLLGLTIHHRFDKAKDPMPNITTLDLSRAEDMVSLLGDLLNKTKGINISDPGFLIYKESRTKTFYIDAICKKILTDNGKIRKSVDRDLSMINALANLYDLGNVRIQDKGKIANNVKKIV